jgi:hypothetical protein
MQGIGGLEENREEGDGTDNEQEDIPPPQSGTA